MKLTKEQKDQLEALLPTLEHKKLKKLLKRAIPVWETEGYEKRHWGVYIEDHKVKRESDYLGCCLIGAGILNVKTDEESWYKYKKPAWSVCGVSGLEFQLIVDVFDAGPAFTDLTLWYLKKYFVHTNQLLVNEVLKIRDILFKESK